VGTDISMRVLEAARAGRYPLERATHVPHGYLRKYCLRGVGSQAGTLMVDPALRRRVVFRQVNLNDKLPDLGQFDVIFLRNVLIYFDPPTKRGVVERLVGLLRSGGWLLTGHSESLNGVTDRVRAVQPTVYARSSP